MKGTVVADRALGINGWLGPTAVHFRDGTITEIVPTSAAGDGSSLVPGFIDLQINGKGAFPAFTDSDEEWRALQNLVLAEGVTTWLPTLTTESLAVLDARMSILRQRCADVIPGSPVAAGIHLEGPFLGSVAGAHPVSHIVAPDFSWVDGIPSEVRLMTVGAESVDAPALIRQLRARAVVVSLGHTNPTPPAFAAAVGAGAELVTHLFNAMDGINHRTPGMAAHALTKRGLAVSLIADGAHVDNLWLGVAAAAKAAEELILVTDSVALGPGVTVRESADPSTGPLAHLPDGTIAGSVLTMDAAVRRMVNNVGIPLANAVVAASTNPARIMGLTDRGVISVGKRADLVVLDSELAIRQVLVAGHEAKR